MSFSALLFVHQLQAAKRRLIDDCLGTRQGSVQSAARYGRVLWLHILQLKSQGRGELLAPPACLCMA